MYGIPLPVHLLFFHTVHARQHEKIIFHRATSCTFLGRKNSLQFPADDQALVLQKFYRHLANYL